MVSFSVLGGACQLLRCALLLMGLPSHARPSWSCCTVHTLSGPRATHTAECLVITSVQLLRLVVNDAAAPRRLLLIVAGLCCYRQRGRMVGYCGGGSLPLPMRGFFYCSQALYTHALGYGVVEEHKHQVKQEKQQSRASSTERAAAGKPSCSVLTRAYPRTCASRASLPLFSASLSQGQTPSSTWGEGGCVGFWKRTTLSPLVPPARRADNVPRRGTTHPPSRLGVKASASSGWPSGDHPLPPINSHHSKLFPP